MCVLTTILFYRRENFLKLSILLNKKKLSKIRKIFDGSVFDEEMRQTAVLKQLLAQEAAKNAEVYKLLRRGLNKFCFNFEERCNVIATVRAVNTTEVSSSSSSKHNFAFERLSE